MGRSKPKGPHKVTVTTTPTRIDAECICGFGVNTSNKDMGRAIVAAFKSQHPEERAR